MAIQFVNVVDFNLNQSQEFVLENLASDPGTGTTDGRLIYNTSENAVKLYNGSAWIALASGTFVATVTAGTYLTNSGTATAVVIDHDATTRTNNSSSASPGYGASFTAIDSITSNATGHVTVVNTKTVTMPAAENYSWTLTGDSGSNQDVASGNTVDIAGGTNITTVVGATDTLTVNLDDSISLSGSLTVGTTGSFTGQVTIPATPVAATDAASKGYVDGLVSGGLTFKGTFRADSGLILSGSGTGAYIYNCPGGAGTRVAVAVGDYYVVATAGGQFYCSGDQLDIGDSIIAVSAAAADSSVVGDWSIVQSDEGVVSLAADTATNLLGINVDSAVGNVKVGLNIDGLANTTSIASGSDDGYIPIYDDGDSTNKKINLTNLAAQIDISKGVRISLDGSLAYVTRTESGGLTTFAVTVSNSSVVSASSALDVTAEITTAAGQTVYADITRSGTTLSVIFSGSVSNGTYSALLVDVG